MYVPQSHGSGEVDRSKLAACGANVVIEHGALIFHPENVHLGDNVYIGHHAILKGYYRNQLVIGDECWIGQGAFLHAAGGITLGRRVGIGPHVCVLSSMHGEAPREVAIMDAPVTFAPVVIGAGSDIGVNAVILPGVTVGEGVQIGPGSVVHKDVPAFAMALGNPARVVKLR
jgi:acetyltransferase-like isoleucine patch superfamily enzyme